MTIGKKRITFCFTVELDLAAGDRLTEALADETRRRWLRNKIESAIEGFLAWVLASDVWKVKVVEGVVRPAPDADEPTGAGYEA